MERVNDCEMQKNEIRRLLVECIWVRHHKIPLVEVLGTKGMQIRDFLLLPSILPFFFVREVGWPCRSTSPLITFFTAASHLNSCWPFRPATNPIKFISFPSLCKGVGRPFRSTFPLFTFISSCPTTILSFSQLLRLPMARFFFLLNWNVAVNSFFCFVVLRLWSVSSLLLLTDGRSARDLPKQLRAKPKNIWGGRPKP